MTPIFGNYGEHKQTTHQPTYTLWSNIKARCYDPANPSYPRYGGRGITMHPTWRSSYATFWRAVGMRPSSAHSLDRIDNNKGYEPGNVRWATSKEQQNNRSNNLLITLSESEGPITIKEAARRLNIKYHTLRWRYLKYGDNLEKLLEPPMSTAAAGKLGGAGQHINKLKWRP